MNRQTIQLTHEHITFSIKYEWYIWYILQLQKFKIVDVCSDGFDSSSNVWLYTVIPVLYAREFSKMCIWIFDHHRQISVTFFLVNRTTEKTRKLEYHTKPFICYSGARFKMREKLEWILRLVFFKLVVFTINIMV